MKKVLETGSILVIVVLVATMVFSGTTMFFRPASADAPDSITLDATIRDFKANGQPGGHVDFENNFFGLEPGIVQGTLGADDKPVYDSSGSPSTHGATAFNQWYNDVTGVNLSTTKTLTLNKISDSPPTYQFNDPTYFPIDNELFGNYANGHNYHFTSEIHTKFTYELGQAFSFLGDDDVWVFINDKLVIDLGGIHGPASGVVNLDAVAPSIGITPGNTYNLDIFQAERHTTGSSFQITTSIVLESVSVGSTTGGQDLAVANYHIGTTSILLGDGTGNFAPRVPYLSGGGSSFVAVGDYNEDGKEDLAVTDNIFGSNKIQVLLGNGDGTFSAPIPVNSIFSAGTIAVADYNNDGHQDLGVTTSGGGLTVNFGDGTGNFSGPNSIATGPGGTIYVVVGDFNKDGNADLATSKDNNANTIAIVLGDGAGSFGTPTIKSTGAFDTRGLATADFNGDGNLDLVTANTGTSNVSVLLGDGTGSFGAATVFPVGAEPYHVAVADFNGDGNLDLVTPNRNHGNFTVLLGDGTGSFGTPTLFANSGGSNFVVVGDFNKDGNADLAMNAGGKASVFLGNGDGTFGIEVLFDAGAEPTGLAVGNFDGASAPADTTPPVVIGTTDRAPDGNGWYNHAVAVTWTGADDGSTASCDPATVYVGPDGSSIVLTGHCTDNAGNVGEGTVTIKYDATAPSITGAPTTSPNANNWYNTDVTVHFEATDGASGISTVTPDTILASEAAGQSITGTVTDNAGNSASFTVSDINIDKTAPVITLTQTPPPNANGWNNQDVTVDFSATDGLSGIDGANTSTTAFTAEGAGQTASATFADMAGNSASASATVNIDRTAPEAYNQFDPATKDVLVYGIDGASGVQTEAIAPSSVTPINWGGDHNDDDDDDHERDNGRHHDDDDNGNAQLRTYMIADNAGNTLVLKEKVKAEGKEIKVQVVSLQYNGGDVIAPEKATKSFEWSVDNKTGAIKELEQKMTVGKGHDKQTMDAKYEANKAQTTIKEGHGGDDDDDHEKKVKLPGLVLLRMATDNGSLMIEY